MKISKEECDKKFADKELILSDEECKKCEFYYLCPFIQRAYDEIVNGD